MNKIATKFCDLSSIYMELIRNKIYFARMRILIFSSSAFNVQASWPVWI